MPIILAAREVEIRKILVGGSPTKTPSQLIKK
jgi:hypothetical protein